MDLQRAWLDLASDSDVARRWFDELAAHYGEAHRHYHTLGHVGALLDLANEMETHVEDDTAIRHAIWFHDVIYDPKQSDNEEASAEMAREALATLGAPERLVYRVAEMILATKNHTLDDPADHDLALFLDLDLSILGSGEESYDRYAEAIRHEYSFVPDALYREERKRILEDFLKRKHLFFSEPMRARFEGSARRNVAGEIGRL